MYLPAGQLHIGASPSGQGTGLQNRHSGVRVSPSLRAPQRAGTARTTRAPTRPQRKTTTPSAATCIGVMRHGAPSSCRRQVAHGAQGGCKPPAFGLRGFDSLTWHHAPLAQMAEQLPLKEWVLGSIPRGCTHSAASHEANRPRMWKTNGMGSDAGRRPPLRIGLRRTASGMVPEEKWGPSPRRDRFDSGCGA